MVASGVGVSEHMPVSHMYQLLSPTIAAHSGSNRNIYIPCLFVFLLVFTDNRRVPSSIDYRRRDDVTRTVHSCTSSTHTTACDVVLPSSPLEVVLESILLRSHSSSSRDGFSAHKLARIHSIDALRRTDRRDDMSSMAVASGASTGLATTDSVGGVVAMDATSHSAEVTVVCVVPYTCSVC